ncbi:MAG: CbiX/SirB N-terminal domain-containing protein [Myxococcales bacterium]|nr:CbiX/SirB N-terminal domain-containing protein [Myxococcales bacterium]
MLKPPTDRLLLVAHGSRRPEWRAPLDALHLDLARRLGTKRVALAFLEACPPDVATAVDAAAADGVTCLRVLPLFLSGGGHVAHDLAPALAALGERCPHLQIELLPALGEHPAIIAAIANLVAD